LLLAEYLFEDSVPSAPVNFHGRQYAYRVAERQGQEEVRFGKLGSKDQNPQTVRHPHIVALQTWETGSKGLACDILSGILLHVATKQATKRHDGEEKECHQSNEELHNTEDSGNLRGGGDTKNVHTRSNVDDEDAE